MPPSADALFQEPRLALGFNSIRDYADVFFAAVAAAATRNVARR